MPSNHSDRIYLYWSGPMPEHIAFCLETVKHHHPGRVVLLEDWVWSLVCDDLEIPSRVKFDFPQHKADIIRAWALSHWGGWWLDSDFLCLAPLDGLIPAGSSFGLYRRVEDPEPKSFENDCMWAAKNSYYAWRYLESMAVRLRHTGYSFPRWGEIGRHLLTELFDKHDDTLHEFPGRLVTWGRRMFLIWDAELPPGEEIDDRVPEGIRGMMLINSVSGKYLKDMKFDDAVKSDMIIGAVYRMAQRRMGRTI